MGKSLYLQVAGNTKHAHPLIHNLHREACAAMHRPIWTRLHVQRHARCQLIIGKCIGWENEFSIYVRNTEFAMNRFHTECLRGGMDKYDGLPKGIYNQSGNDRELGNDNSKKSN